MANTYVKIATVTVGGGGAANMEFTSIPATYTDLVLLTSTRATTNNAGMTLEFNGSATSRTIRSLYGDGTNPASYSGTVALGGLVNYTSYTSNTFSNNMLYIPNYAGSTNKSSSMDGVLENNATATYTFLSANLWSNTSAITSIKLAVETSGDFVQYSTATLYGIKNS